MKINFFSNKPKHYLTQKDIENLSCFFCLDSQGLLATVFSNFPLPLKRHCVQVGAAAGRMALHVPDSAIPNGMTREEYANAVRYGSLYHNIGAYLVYNQKVMYPTAGARFLKEQMSERKVNPAARKVILETVRNYGERYDGKGYPDKLSADNIPLHAQICAIANQADKTIPTRRGFLTNPIAETKRIIIQSKGRAFSPVAVNCFMAAYGDIEHLYKCWRKTPPFWKNTDIKPLNLPITAVIG